MAWPGAWLVQPAGLRCERRFCRATGQTVKPRGCLCHGPVILIWGASAPVRLAHRPFGRPPSFAVAYVPRPSTRVRRPPCRYSKA